MSKEKIKFQKLITQNHSSLSYLALLKFQELKFHLFIVCRENARKVKEKEKVEKKARFCLLNVCRERGANNVACREEDTETELLCRDRRETERVMLCRKPVIEEGDRNNAALS